MPANSRSWGFNVSEGLEHENGCDFPESGKSCNKSNTSGADASRYSPMCSVYDPIPGLRVTVRQARASAPLVAAPPVSGSQSPRTGRAAFSDELGDIRVRRPLCGTAFRDTAGYAQSWLSWCMTLRCFRIRIEYVASRTFCHLLGSGQFGLGQNPQDKSPVPAAYRNEAETEDIEQ